MKFGADKMRNLEPNGLSKGKVKGDDCERRACLWRTEFKAINKTKSARHSGFRIFNDFCNKMQAKHVFSEQNPNSPLRQTAPNAQNSTQNSKNLAASSGHDKMQNKAKNSGKILERRAVITAGLTAFFLAVVKFIAGLASGSVAVLSSAIDSMLDLLVSALNFFALRKSTAAPNAKFNFGYTKLEAIAAMFEGVLIVGVGAFIFYESIMKIRADEHAIDLNIGIYVMIFSAAVTGALVAFLSRAAKRTQNLILKADALHYKSDLYTNFAVLAALLIIKFTGLGIVDAIFGILISGYIAVSAINLMKESLFALLDEALAPEIVLQIERIINQKKEVSGFHGLTSRKSSNICYLGVHLVFDREISLLRAHEISDEIEREIAAKFSEFEWVFMSHLDPFDDGILDRNGRAER